MVCAEGTASRRRAPSSGIARARGGYRGALALDDIIFARIVRRGALRAARIARRFRASRVILAASRISARIIVAHGARHQGHQASASTARINVRHIVATCFRRAASRRAVDARDVGRARHLIASSTSIIARRRRYARLANGCALRTLAWHNNIIILHLASRHLAYRALRCLRRANDMNRTARTRAWANIRRTSHRAARWHQNAIFGSRRARIVGCGRCALRVGAS